MATGRKKLASDLNQSEQNIRTALGLLEKMKILTIESTNTHSIITLVNWEKYQSQQHELTNEPTNAQPTPNQLLTTVKEGKEGEELKEDKGPNYFTILMDCFKKHDIVITDRNPRQIAIVQSKAKTCGESEFRATAEAYCKDEFLRRGPGLSINGFLNNFDRFYNKANQETIQKKKALMSYARNFQ